MRAGRASRQLTAALASSKAAVEELRQLAEDPSTTKLGDLLRSAASSELIELDPRMAAYLHPDGEHGDVVLDERAVNVLNAMSECALSELEGYYTYVKQESPYSTQHGTKGSEFERVVVVLDDNEGRSYTSYSYDSLFGLKELSATDLDNQSKGVDSAIERTRRLFYVCVSRARESLAVVLFSVDVDRAVAAVRKSAIGQHVRDCCTKVSSPVAARQFRSSKPSGTSVVNGRTPARDITSTCTETASCQVTPATLREPCLSFPHSSSRASLSPGCGGVGALSPRDAVAARPPGLFRPLLDEHMALPSRRRTPVGPARAALDPYDDDSENC